MEIISIVAMAANRVIGESRSNSIPWAIPGEQQRFKKITMGHTMIMGRKAYESIGKPLPGRESIVISRNSTFTAPGCTVLHTLQDALRSCANRDKVFIIGGAEIYRLAMEDTDTIIMTILDRPVAGDIFFPEFSAELFKLVHIEKVEDQEPYRILTFQRKKDTPERAKDGEEL